MAFFKLIILAIISIVMLVLAGLAYDWLRNRLGIKPPPPPQPQPAKPTPELVYNVYPAEGYCLFCCANDFAVECGLARSARPEKIFVPDEERVRGTMQRPILIYELQRDIVGRRIVDGQSVVTYTTVSLDKIVTTLNRKLGEYCRGNGSFPVHIVVGREIGEGKILLGVADSPANIWGQSNV